MIAPVGAMKLCLEPLDRHQTPHRIGQTAIAAIIASMFFTTSIQDECYYRVQAEGWAAEVESGGE